MSRFRLAATLWPGVAGEVGHEPGQLFPEGREQELDGPFAGLEQDVADEPVADDDADVPFVDVAALDVADEPGRPGAVLKQRAGRAGQLGPFLVLGADVQQADARARHAQDRLGVDRPHDAVLVEVLGLGVHVGADVDDHDRPLVRREDRGDARAGGRRAGTSWR